MKKHNKTFIFNKIDYNHTGKKAYLVQLEINLRINDDHKIDFSASGDVWNTKHTDIVMGGQCIDSIWNEYASQIHDVALYKTIMDLWKKWHRNDVNAGCKHQRKLKWTYEQHPSEPCPTCGYKMGTAWKYNKIDQKDLKTICSLLQLDNLETLRILKINKSLESE